MTQPPYGSEPGRPQDRPQDTTRPLPAAPGQGQQQWATPGQPSYGQQPPQYGQQPGQYGQSTYGQQYAQTQYGYGYGGYGYRGSGGTNGLATAALVCGLGGLVIGFSAPVGIGLGIAALVQIKRTNQDGKGMAIAGLVIGSLITIGYLLLFIFLIVLGSRASDGEYYGAPTATSSHSSTIHSAASPTSS